MSLMGIVGAAIGGFLGGPMGAMRGYSIGSMVDGYLNPPKGPDVHGPRLNDLSVQGAAYGAYIGRAYGTVALSGNVFWIENNKIREVVSVTEAEGGKGDPLGGGGGGGDVYSYSYFGTFAVGLCRGPILGVRRIWIGGKLFYDAVVTGYGAAAAASDNSQYFTLYKGTETQQADPRMQATLGAANVPGYRGLAYIVFKDLPLAAYGNSIATTQIKVEVVAAGSATEWAPENRQVAGTLRAAACDGKRTFLLSDGTTVGYSADGGLTYTAIALPGSIGTGRSATDGDGMVLFIGSTTTAYYLVDADKGQDWYFRQLEARQYSGNYYVDENGNYTDGYGNVYSPGTVFDTMTYTAAGYFGATTLPNANLGACACANSVYCAVPATGSTGAVGIFDASAIDFNWRETTLPAAGSWRVATDGTAFVAVMHGGGAARGVLDYAMDWVTYTIGQTVTFTAGDLPAGDWVDIAWDGAAFVAIEANSRRAAKSADGLAWTVYATALPSAAAWSCLASNGEGLLAALSASTAAATSEDHGETWTARTMSTTGCVDLAWNGAYFVAAGSGTYAATIAVSGIVPGAANLADIIEAECLLSGVLEAGDIDTTLIADTVRGYRIGPPATIRSALEPLQAAYRFDVAQSGYTVKFIPRGLPFTDDDYDDVLLLAHLDDLTEVTGKTLTARHGAEISTEQSVFGGHALKLPDADSAIVVSSPEDFAFDYGGDFCIELRAYLNAAGTAQRIVSGGMTLCIAADSATIWLYPTDAPAHNWRAAVALTEGWTAIAFESSGGAGTFFIDGEAVAATRSGLPSFAFLTELRLGA